MEDSKHLPALSETMQFVPQTDSSVVSVADSFPTGTPFGHYVIRKYIGGGGMGRVYLATDTALDRDVAIKVLPQQRAGDHGIVARFMNEAKSAARLNHEHIAQVYFAGEESGVPYIAFEYVEGINVRTMVEEHDVFPLPQALNYLLQIAHALAHAATHGVIHRDVKPSNILITREGRAKLIDMGLARLLDTSEARGDLTASGVTLGTFDYISPEQARDPRNADIRSDIYSLGCTFFFMLAGRPPFPEGTVLQKLLQHQGDAPPDIRSFQPAIPAEIAFLIQKMMAKDPKQRFQTPTVLIEALTDVARRLGLRPAGQGNLVWTPAPAKRTSFLLRHLPWMSAVLLLLVGYFLMTLFSEQFYGTLPPPEFLIQNVPVPPITEDIPPPADPGTSLVSSFDIAFVSHSAASSARPFTGLQAPVSGGSLQPAVESTVRLSHVLNNVLNSKFSLADIRLANQRTTAPRTYPLTETRCVDPTGNTPGSYLSLASALTGVDDGTDIELKWNGEHRMTEPVSLNQRKLQFVAAEGYTPILLFEPTESQKVRNLFTVASSHLEFKGVGIEVRLDPSILLAHWSLFELAGHSRLTFDKCCLTLQNRSLMNGTAYHDDVVFFRSNIPADSVFSEGADYTTDMIAEPLTIEITQSLLRGEAVAISSDAPQDIQIKLTQSFVALAKPFIQVEEHRRAAKQATIQIRWNKVAFFGRQGVADLHKEMTAGSIIINFEAQQSIFVLHHSFFVDFRGMRGQQSALDDFRWSGTANYFQGVAGLRFPVYYSSSDSGTAYEMPFEEWRRQWDTDDQTKVDTLTLSEITKYMSRYLPQDVYSHFDSAGKAALPNFDWFPRQWNND